MNTWHTYRNDPAKAADHQTLGHIQARRRRVLGIMLIVVGSMWL